MNQGNNRGRLLQRLSVTVAAFVFLIGMLVLLGWRFDIVEIKSVFPTFPTMKVNTAVGFCLSAVSLWSVGPSIFNASSEVVHRRQQRHQSIVRICAVALLLLSAATLGEYLFGWRLGIDELFVQDVGRGPETLPGRMAPATAASFLAMSVALLLIDVKLSRDTWPTQWLALAVAINGFVGSLGFLYDVEYLYGSQPYASMAVHTALLFVMLGVGLLCARPDRGLAQRIIADDAGGMFLRRLIPAAIFVPVIVGYVRYHGELAGYYSWQFGLAVYTAANVMIFCVLVWRSANSVRQANSARLQAERFRWEMAALVESADDAILSKNLDGIVRSWNSAAERLLGYRADEIIGQPVTRFIPDDRQDEESEIIRQIKLGISVDHFETVRRRKDGSLVEVSLTISPIRNHDGVVVGASKIMRDITEQKRFENELRRSNAELEYFAYVASHDLQEPLRMVAAYTELLAQRYRGRLDERADKYIDYAVDGAKRMQHLVADLLAFSRVGSQGKPLVPVAADSVLKSVIHLLREPIRKSGAAVEVGTLPVVLADEGQLCQLFQNLIGNAIKFRGDSPPRIVINAERQNQHWLLSVNDNGIGIDMQYAERIFQMFQRLHERGEYEGSGIGLAIAKKIIERHGGRIWLESQLGHGTTFFFTLPVTAERDVP
jgi:PAS domain S-box-containing protein